jgi:large subunit ribosomal protein L15
MPLARRVPKRGFFNGAFKKSYVVVNLAALEERYDAGAVVDEKALRALGLVKGQEHDGIKILGTGTISKPLEVHATKFSASAEAKIRSAGGKVVVVPYRPHAVSGRPAEAAPKDS